MVLAERIRILAPIGKIEMLGADIGLGHLQLTDLPLQPADAGLVSGLPCVVQQHCLLSLQRKPEPHAQEFQIAAYGFQHLGKLIDLQLQLILRNVLEVSGGRAGEDPDMSCLPAGMRPQTAPSSARGVCPGMSL